MIRSLQSLRGVFTIVIFLSHFPFPLTSAFSIPSDCAVSFFFMLSGFVLCGAHERKMGLRKYRFTSFMRNRLQRIYPMYLICLAAALAINHFHTYPLQIISHLLLLQSWFPNPDIYFGLNGASWFLSTLMFCYLLLFPAVRLATRHSSLFYVMLAAAVILYLAAIPSVKSDLRTWVLYICPLTRTLDFLIGIVLYQIYKRIRATFETPAIPADCIATAITAIALIAAPAVGETYTLACWWWLPNSLLIISFALCDKSRWPLVRLAHTSLPVSFGNLSFSFYIIHGVVLTVIVRLMGHINPVPPVWFSLGITFALCTVAAWLSHRYLESNRIFRLHTQKEPHLNYRNLPEDKPIAETHKNRNTNS